jgi:hypothetical protein
MPTHEISGGRALTLAGAVRAAEELAHGERQKEARRHDVTLGDAWDEYVDCRKGKSI